jgi:SAM-dependent methyltransferase
VDSAFIRILRCPRTRQPLRAMSESELAEVGRRTGRTWQAGVTTPDGAVAYPVDDGIFGLVEGLAVERNRSDRAQSAVKQAVQRFYDEVGWQRSEGGQPFADAERFEDLRPVAREYIHACHLRVNRFLRRPGRYLLDVASGPIQYPEYLTYTEGFEHRICIDLSRAALTEAKKTLGERGRYVLGDITNLPLQDDSVDGVVSLHTLIHVPAEEQERGFLELHRVLRPGHRGVVVYSWGDSLLTGLLLLPAWPAKQALRWLRRWRGDNGALYYHAHPYSWFSTRSWPFRARVLTWRSLGVLPMRAWVHGALGGAALLRGVFALEERFPELIGRIAQYPLIVIEKADARAVAAAPPVSG